MFGRRTSLHVLFKQVICFCILIPASNSIIYDISHPLVKQYLHRKSFRIYHGNWFDLSLIIDDFCSPQRRVKSMIMQDDEKKTKKTYSHIFQREGRDPEFILEFRNIKQKSRLSSVFTEVFYFFSKVKSSSAYFILVQRIERKSGRKKKRETTRTKNINILFLRSCIHYNSKSRSKKNLLNKFFVDWDRFHL